MALRYSLICSLNLNFNFKDIKTILSKKESEILRFLHPITGEEIYNLQNVMIYFKEMQLIDDPISINIMDQKYNQFYKINFLNVEDTLVVSLAFYEENIKKRLFHHNIEFPNNHLYLQILLNLVKDYSILSIEVYCVWD